MMESERVIIMIGHCRSGKHAMIRQALKGRAVLIVADSDSRDMASAIASLNMSFQGAVIAAKNASDAMKEFKAITPDRTPSFRDHYFRDEALKLRSFQENENTIVYEKQPSKFISRPRHNFRKR